MFTTNHTVKTTVIPSIDEDKLKIEFRRLGISVALADAVIPMQDFHSTIFRMALNIVSNTIVLPRLNALGGHGLVLPSLEGLRFVNQSVVLSKDAIFIASDL